MPGCQSCSHDVRGKYDNFYGSRGGHSLKKYCRPAGDLIQLTKVLRVRCVIVYGHQDVLDDSEHTDFGSSQSCALYAICSEHPERVGMNFRVTLTPSYLFQGVAIEVEVL